MNGAFTMLMGGVVRRMCVARAYTSLLLFRFISSLCDSPPVVIVIHAMAEAVKRRRVGDPGAGVDPAQPHHNKNAH